MIREFCARLRRPVFQIAKRGHEHSQNERRSGNLCGCVRSIGPLPNVYRSSTAPDIEDRVDVKSMLFHSKGVELETLRLALRIDDREVLVGRGDDDVLALGVMTRRGGGGCLSLRWVLRERGAIVITNSNADGILVIGLVDDNVLSAAVKG